MRSDFVLRISELETSNCNPLFIPLYPVPLPQLLPCSLLPETATSFIENSATQTSDSAFNEREVAKDHCQRNSKDINSHLVFLAYSRYK